MMNNRSLALVLAFLLIDKLLTCVSLRCPEVCHCFNHTQDAMGNFPDSHEYTIECASLRLQAFPHDIDPDVTHLYLNDNDIPHISLKMLAKFTKLKSLTLSENKISSLEDGSFDRLTELEILDLSGNRIPEISAKLFGNLSHLDELILNDNPITNVVDGALDQLVSLKNLHLSSTLVQAPPVFTVSSSVIHLYLDQTNIHHISMATFEHYDNLEGLYLKRSAVKELTARVFFHTKLLKHLLMEYSDLRVIAEDSFEGLQLETLMLQGSSIDSLPAIGLSELRILNVRGVTDLWEIKPQSLPNVRHLLVNYEFLCCPFKNREYKEPGEVGQGEGLVRECKNKTTTQSGVPAASPTRSTTARWLGDGDLIFINSNESMNPLTLDPCDVHILPSGAVAVQATPTKTKIVCLPKPDDFNPCEDLLGADGLRACTWLVAISATIGNLLTLIVLLLNRRKVTNHKLLMCTLAFSNLCMGLYLFILASVDMGSKGRYNKYAKEWQHGIGCKTSGFLSIFSTELAVFTLNIVTLERYYTIVYPLHQTKWLTIRQTSILLIFSFFTALVLAILPLIGVSSYSKVAICLPFDVHDSVSKGYVSFLLASNGASFFAILFCYVKMYLSIQHSTNATFVDLNIAKKMALIVITNFSCWAPVALLSLFAIYGEPLINVPTSKFLLVFVFPINAFTNPFLYFLGTSRFQHDFKRLLACCSLCLVRLKPVKPDRSLREVTTTIRLNPTQFLPSVNRSRSRSDSATRQTTSNDSQRTSVATPREPEHKNSIFRRNFHLPFALFHVSGSHRNSSNDSSVSTGRRQSYEMAVRIEPEVDKTINGDSQSNNVNDSLILEQSSVEKAIMFESGC